MIRKIEGIVISEKPYKESSKLLQVVTKEEGVISLMAKGARGMKSDLRAGTVKLTKGDFMIYYKEDGLSTLTAVDIQNSYKEIKKDITKISYASFLIELAQQVMKQRQCEEIYDLLDQALEKINDGFDPLIICNIIELKYLQFLGVMPSLDECVLCGSKNNLATLSADKGGYVCQNCLTNDAIVSDKTMKLIRMYYYVDISKISKLEVSPLAKKEINMFLDLYYERYTGLYLRTKSFLKNLNQLQKI